MNFQPEQLRHHFKNTLVQYVDGHQAFLADQPGDTITWQQTSQAYFNRHNRAIIATTSGNKYLYAPLFSYESQRTSWQLFDLRSIAEHRDRFATIIALPHGLPNITIGEHLILPDRQTSSVSHVLAEFQYDGSQNSEAQLINEVNPFDTAWRAVAAYEQGDMACAHTLARFAIEQLSRTPDYSV